MPSIINSDDGVVSGTSGLKTTGGNDGLLNIQSNGSTVVAMTGSGVSVTGTLTASGATTLSGAVSASSLSVNSNNISADNSLGFRNRIINGAMVIDQRNAGASVTPTTDNTYTLDRWTAKLSQSSKYSVQQSSTAPTGFRNSLLVTSLSAYTVGSFDNFFVKQVIEGFNIADLMWGTANARAVTLSFQVRSSLTGTFGGALFNSDGSRSYPFTYTISSANTYETKTISIAGDTSGTWLTTNGAGINIAFGLGVGSTYSGTAGSWAGTLYFSATGATSVVGTNGATFYITGVQLEVGSTATPFERRPYGTELALCQRYFQVYGGQSGAPNFQGYGSGDMNSIYPLPVEMRTVPTGTTSGNWTKSNCGDPTLVHAATTAVTIRTAITSLGKFEVYPSSSAPIGKITMSSEL